LFSTGEKALGRACELSGESGVQIPDAAINGVRLKTAISFQNLHMQF
jgi:hypothetical protein